MSGGIQEILDRRRRERDRMVATARRFVEDLDPELGVRTAVLFGSVARGDFNLWSDVDVLVVADRLPARPQHRQARVAGQAPPGVAVVAWTPEELALEHRRGNPIALEAARDGIVLLGAGVGAAVAASPPP